MSESSASANTLAQAAKPLLLVAAALALGFVAGRWAGRGHELSEAGAVELLRDRPTEGSPLVAEVDGKKVTLAQFLVRWEQLSPETQRFHRDRGGPEHFLDEVLEELLLAEEAIDRGYGERPDVREGFRREVDRVLSRPLLADEVRARAISEREVRTRFELRQDEWGEPAQVRIREIRVTAAPGPLGLGVLDDATTPEEAEAKIRRLHERLMAGESFEGIAAASSEAPSSRYGGLIGWVVEGRLAMPYEERALSMAAGEISEPIPLEDGGWVILLAEERKEAREARFEDHREEILRGLLEEDPGAMNRRYRVFVEELKRRHDVRVDTEPVRRAFRDEVAR